MKRHFLHQAVGLLSALLLIAQTVCADNSSVNAETNKPLPIMPSVQVAATRIAPTTGTFIIDKEMIDSLPVRNGSVNEIISIVPGVQYSEAHLSSFTGGEITPPVVSISGSRFYDNNYTIDGFSNNSHLDPASDAISDFNKLPGHPQAQFLNSRIIDQVTVYDSNIPAEFGSFTGGQVDTLTISPTEELWGELSYRTTNDSLTSFHIDPDDEDDFENSNSVKKQPDFTKHDFGVTLNTPLGKDTGLVTSYQQLASEIPLQHLGKTKTQTRKREVFFLKLEHYLSASTILSLTSLYTPTENDYFLAKVKDSDYSLNNKNYSFTVRLDKEFSTGQLLFTLGYGGQKINRKAAQNKYYWSTATPSIDWDTGKEGSIGDLETKQRDSRLKIDYLLRPLKWGQTSHQIKLGIETGYSEQFYRRPEVSFFYYRPRVNSSTTCDPGDHACIDGEQYLSRRTKYNISNSRASVTDYAAYLQDSIVWKRLELFPGIRMSRDNLTDHVNVAPRLSTALDLFGNRKTILFAGQNRYYSGTLLTQSLFQSIITENQVRTTYGNDESDWTSRVSFYYRDNKVETPYTDETTAGIIQQLFGGNLKFQYIKKISKKEFARSRIDNPYPEPDIYVLNNLGKSRHDSYQISWQRSWRNHFLEINGTWQETTTSNTDYDTTLDIEDFETTIWYKGEELYPDEIHRLDFNRPFIGNLVYTFRVGNTLTFTNTTKYRGAYWRLWNTKERRPSVDHPEQSPDPYIYEKRKSHSSILFDWHFSWRVPQFSKYDLIFSADIFNVFDRRTKIGYQTGLFGYDYEIGRQLWVGLDFKF